MKSSNHLLAKKEQAISQLQASLAQQVMMWLTHSKETKGCTVLVALCVLHTVCLYSGVCQHLSNHSLG